MPDTTDPAASALDEIRADHEAANAFGANASDPVPRLLAAVEAALKLADDWGQVSALHGYECAAALRAAIGAALAGKEADR